MTFSHMQKSLDKPLLVETPILAPYGSTLNISILYLRIRYIKAKLKIQWKGSPRFQGCLNSSTL